MPIPAEVAAQLPEDGMQLETRLQWPDPIRREGTLFIPAEPLSLRLVSDDKVVWEHRYPAAENLLPTSAEPAVPPSSVQTDAPAPPAPGSAQGDTHPAIQNATPVVVAAASDIRDGTYCLKPKGGGLEILILHPNSDGSVEFGVSDWTGSGSNFSVSGTAVAAADGWHYEDGLTSADPAERCAVNISYRGGTYDVSTVDGARCEAMAGNRAVLYGTLSFPSKSRVGAAQIPIDLEHVSATPRDRSARNSQFPTFRS